MEDNPKIAAGKMILSYGLNLVLALLCLFLFIQNKEMKYVIRSSTALGQVEPLRAGEKIEPIVVNTLSGDPVPINFVDPSRKYLFFILSTACPHCEKTLSAWKTLTKGKPDNCDVLGISLQNSEETIKYVEKKDVGFVLTSACGDTSFQRKYKISGVPETILVGGNGIVEKSWLGELSADQIGEIQRLLNSGKSGFANKLTSTPN
jgi:peroxiredoxin